MDLIFHPQFVHFPIAFLLLGGLAYAVAYFKEREFFLRMGFLLHIAGWLGSIASILTGRAAEAEVVHTQAIHELITLHERLAYLVAWLFAMLGIWMFLRQKKISGKELILFLLLFWGSNAAMAYMAHLGGEMVYEEGAGVIPMEEKLKEQLRNEQSQLQPDSL